MNEEDILRDALAGIKTKRTRRRVSKFNPEDGLLFEADEGKAYVPGKGILQIHEIKEKLLDCGHSGRIGLGHIAECGHAVCALCIERFVLECAKEACFRKLCTVRGCRYSACYVDGVFFCKKHSFWASIDSFGCFFLLGKSGNEERVIAMLNDYYSRRLQLRGDK